MKVSWTITRAARCAYLSRALLLLVSAGFSLVAQATTYYIDALNGNDGWSGTANVPSGAPLNNGPWRTLARVQAATLAPGDNIRLRCDQTWREPLTLSATGTAVAPILVGRYAPASCTNNPVINAEQAIPDYAWTRQSGNVYQVRYPVNLLRTAGSTAGFTAWSANADHTLLADTSCASPTSACVTLTSGASQTLAISGNFAVEAGNRLNIEFRVRAPSGVSIIVIPRRGAVPWDTLGTIRTIVGTGNWQTFTYESTFTTSSSVARVDFVVPAGRQLSITDLRVGFAAATPTQLLSMGTALPVAHHPNRGFDSTRPTSMFASIGANADRVALNGGTVSTYLTPGANFVLPPGGSVTPGLGITVRTNGWMMDELKVANQQNGNIVFDRPSTYPIDRNWGFFLSGARWMLDSPGEWHYDPATSLLTVWMPDSLAPRARLGLSTGDVGLDLSNSAFVYVSNVDVRGFTVGVRMRSGNTLRFLNGTIANSGEFGVDAVDCQLCELRGNVINNSLRDAVSATTMTGETTDGLRVIANRITNSGASGQTSSALDLPLRSLGAVRGGKNAVIQDNIITNTGYIGIRANPGSVVTGNRVENACLILDDCAGIYTLGADNASNITSNAVINVVGNTDGMPSFMTTLTSGLYFDDLSSGVVASNNTITGADNGLHLHNAFLNTITNNTFYGNRRYQVWAQEGSKRLHANGDLYGNLVSGNRFFPAVPLHPIQQETVFGSTNNFATYSGNRYSTLLLRTVANEQWGTGASSHDLPTWQSARGQDQTATEINSIGYATFSSTGTNQVPNGKLSNGKSGWTYWNATAPFGSVIVEACPQGNCIRFVAGATPSLLSTPNFSTVRDTWYRISFDAKTLTANQSISVTVRRGGGGANSYEGLAAGSQSFTGSTVWARYAFVFKATKTINAADPVTGDLGARIDFDRTAPGTAITIGNVEMIPLSPIETALKTRIVVNSTALAATIDCPDQAIMPALCTQFVKFSDGLPIPWPYLLPARSSEVIFSRDTTLIDSDNDGIPTFQDQCPSTAAGAYANARGCSFTQSPAG